MRHIVCVIALLIALPACGSGARKAARSSGMGGGDAESASAAPLATPAPSAQSATGGAAPATNGEPPPSAPAKFWNMKPGENKMVWGSMKLDVELSPLCAKTGTAMKAVVRTLPDASVGAAVRYPDNDPHGDFSWGPHLATGDWVWTWTIKPGIPKGVATVMVTAGKAGERGASRAAAFKIAERC